MIFACIIDAGLIPFLIFTSWYTYSEMEMGSLRDTSNAWTTMDIKGFSRDQILMSTFYTSAALGGLLAMSFGISIYLAVQFRKISNLPPDMNPLEDNLTGRSAHKRNKSSIPNLSSQLGLDEKGNRLSVADPLMDPARSVPFMNTRNNSSTSLSASSSPDRERHPSHLRNDSQATLSPPRPYHDRSRNGSAASLSGTQRRHGHARQDSAGSIPLSPTRSSYTSSPRPPRGSSLRPTTDQGTPSRRSYHDESPRTSRPGTARLMGPVPLGGIVANPPTPAPSGRSSANRNPNWPLPASGESNWFAHAGADDPPSPPLERALPEFRHLRDGPAMNDEDENEMVPEALRVPNSSKYDFRDRSPRPLAMNPPTPPVEAGRASAAATAARERVYGNGSVASERTFLTTTSGNRGVGRGQYVEEYAVRGEEMGYGNGNRGGNGYYELAQRTPERKIGGKRVVSSGYDDLGEARQGKVRSRQVSGKVAEEGRGGMAGMRAEYGWM